MTDENAARAINRAHDDANTVAASAALAKRNAALAAAIEAAMSAYDAVPIVRAADPRADAREIIAKGAA